MPLDVLADAIGGRQQPSTPSERVEAIAARTLREAVMPRFSTRLVKQPEKPGTNGISDALIRMYEKYIQRIDDDSLGELKFRKSEDISRAREALRIAGNKLRRDLIIRRPRGVHDVLRFRLREKPLAATPATVRTRTIATWGLNQAEADRIFGISRSVVDQWRQQGMLAQAISEIDAANSLLRRYLRADRIPVVVRRPIQARDGVSLLEILEQGDTTGLLMTCRDMFAAWFPP